MIHLPLRCIVLVSLFAQVQILLAQQPDSLKRQIIIDSVLVDSIAKPIVNSIQDSPFKLLHLDASKKYNLEDLEQARKYDSLWMREFIKNIPLFDEMQEEVLSQTPLNPESLIWNTDTLKLRLERLNAKTPFNITYNPSLEAVIKSFVVRKRNLMEKMLTISQFYFPLFEQELDNQDIPLEMKYLAIVESALNPKARSRVGATGLWQFMYGTGKEMKLKINSYVDERSDPIKSTRAAAQYLKRLHKIYDDWDLALAAYNSGPGNVNKAIRRSGGQKNYWNIRRNLPRETAGYVPAFLATMYVFEYADQLGLKRSPVKQAFFETDTVHVKSFITFDQIAKLIDADVEELRVLNPSYKLDAIPFIKGEQNALRLTSKAMGKFVANEQAIYAHISKELKAKESPLPALVKQANENSIRYSVRSGDYLGKIAARFGVGVSQIKQWNGIRGTSLRIGQRLTIYPRNTVKPTHAVVKSKSFTLPKDPSKIHEVKSGDSLWTISKKYLGISVEDLQKWNGLSSHNLKPGTKLRLCNCSS